MLSKATTANGIREIHDAALDVLLDVEKRYTVKTEVLDRKLERLANALGVERTGARAKAPDVDPEEELRRARRVNLEIRRAEQLAGLRGPGGTDLRGPGLARRTDPETAKAAAAKTGYNRRVEILAMFLRAGERGLTRDEIRHELDVDSSYFSSRITDLKHAGLVVPNGTRESDAGQSQTVYVATAHLEEVTP